MADHPRESHDPRTAIEHLEAFVDAGRRAQAAVDQAIADGVTRHPVQRCPLCAATMDAAGTFDGAAVVPAPGDWTVCSKCLQWLVYLDGFALRAVTNAEWLALSEDERTQLTQQRERVARAWGHA